MRPTRLLTSATLAALFVLVLLPGFLVLLAPLAGGRPDPGEGWHTLLEPRRLALAGNSLSIAGGAALIALTLGFPLALLLERFALPLRRFLRAMLPVPLLIPPYLHALTWHHLSPTLIRLGLPDLHGRLGAAFVLALAYLPFVTLPVASGLGAIDLRLEEAALLAHPPGRVRRRIILPLLFPHLAAGVVLVFVFALLDFGVPDLLRVRVYPVEIFVQYSALYDPRSAARLALPLIAAAGLLIAAQRAWMGDRSYIQAAGRKASSVPPRGLGRWRDPALAFCLVVVLFSVGAPLAVLLRTAGPAAVYLQAWRSSWPAILYSLALAAAAALLVLPLALATAHLTARLRGRASFLLETVAFLPLAVPAAALGIGLITLWNRPFLGAVYGSSAMVVLGYLARFFPFAAVTLTAGMRQVDPAWEEAAALCTGRRGLILRRVLLPPLRASLLTAFALVFLLALGELGTTLLVLPPGRETLPVRAYNLLHYGADAPVAALSLTQLGLAFGLLSLLRRLFGRGLTEAR